MDPEKERLRQAFIDEVKSWVGTPYSYGGCVKKGGTNCVSFILRSAEITFPHEEGEFEEFWKNDHRDVIRNRRNVVLEGLLKMGREIEGTIADLRPGDILVTTFFGIPLQMAVAVGDGQFVYGTQKMGVVQMYPPLSITKRKVTAVRLKWIDEEAK